MREIVQLGQSWLNVAPLWHFIGEAAHFCATPTKLGQMCRPHMARCMGVVIEVCEGGEVSRKGRGEGGRVVEMLCLFKPVLVNYMNGGIS